LLALSLLLAATPVGASFHMWEIVEVYSNADGSVQYIELYTSFSAQTSLMNQDIVAISNGIIHATFTFGSNLVGETANRRVLIATTGFAALPGAVPPDYTLPCGFLDLSATTITINFVGSDSLTFSVALLPVDGANSLIASPGGAISAGASSPTNFAGSTGALTLPPCCAPAGCLDEIFADGFEVSAGP
jgi:hypothetical protein